MTEWPEKTEENLEIMHNLRMNLQDLASNSYRRTRLFKDPPTFLMDKWLKNIRGKRNFIKRINFPCNLANMDAASQALADAILDFRKTGGMIEPATYQGGADPKNAETLSQFSLFLHKRINQPMVYGNTLKKFGEYWDAFIQDFERAYKMWMDN